MYAVEFESAVMDGMIKIPYEYKEKIGKTVKVILLSNIIEEEKKEVEFSATTIPTKGYKFDREYANER